MKRALLAILCGIVSMSINGYGGSELFAQQQPQAASQGSTQEAAAAETGSEAVNVSSAIDIRRLEGQKPLYSIELRDAQLGDLFRVIAHDYNLNIIFDNSISGSITASFSNISLDEALAGIAELSNLVMEKKGTIIRLSPNFITRTIVLKYVEAKKILEGSASAGSQGVVSAGSGSAAGTIYDLLSPKGKVFLGSQPNSVTVIDYPPSIVKVEDYLKAIDQKMTSRVFKLKYLKASDVVGDTVPAQSQTSSTTTGSASSASGITTTSQ